MTAAYARCCNAHFVRPSLLLPPLRRCHLFEDCAEPEHHRAGAHQPQRLCELRERSVASVDGCCRRCGASTSCARIANSNQAVRCYACASFAKTDCLASLFWIPQFLKNHLLKAPYYTSFWPDPSNNPGKVRHAGGAALPAQIRRFFPPLSGRAVARASAAARADVQQQVPGPLHAHHVL